MSPTLGCGDPLAVVSCPTGGQRAWGQEWGSPRFVGVTLMNAEEKCPRCQEEVPGHLDREGLAGLAWVAPSSGLLASLAHAPSWTLFTFEKYNK